MKTIQGMSVLITGGGSGIGEATARFLAERGAKVTISGRREDKLAAVVADIVDSYNIELSFSRAQAGGLKVSLTFQIV